jgi:hypothetical protein
VLLPRNNLSVTAVTSPLSGETRGVRCGGVALSVSLTRDSSPKGGAKGERWGCPHCFCKYFVSRNPRRARALPLPNPAQVGGKGRALALRSGAATEKVGGLERVAPPEQPLCHCGDISPFRGDKELEIWNPRLKLLPPLKGEVPTAAGGGVPPQGNPRPPQGNPRLPQGLAPPLGELSRVSETERAPRRSGLGSPLGGAVPRSGTERAIPPQRTSIFAV